MKTDPHSHHPPDPARQGNSRHQPHLDTVAQKPTHIGAGVRTTGPHRDADMDNRDPTPGAQPPEESARPTLRKPHQVAAGMPALLQSIKFTLRETGLSRGLRTWLKVNKKNGFDCQSCAWPNPDSHRHLFEFCENGVKALSSEATLKHVTPAFFREHSIADLRKQSDYWLELQGRIVHPMVKRGKRHPLRANRVGRGFPATGPGTQGPAFAQCRRLLHQWPGQQRGRIPLSALCPSIRHQ